MSGSCVRTDPVTADIPLGQDHPGDAGRGDSGEGTLFIAAEVPGADKGRDFQVLLVADPVYGGLDVYGFAGWC